MLSGVISAFLHVSTNLFFDVHDERGDRNEYSFGRSVCVAVTFAVTCLQRQRAEFYHTKAALKDPALPGLALGEG